MVLISARRETATFLLKCINEACLDIGCLHNWIPRLRGYMHHDIPGDVFSSRFSTNSIEIVILNFAYAVPREDLGV